MELLTPQQIWKGCDPSALPLNVNMLTDVRRDGLREVTAYFSGPTTTDGVVRVFARCLAPAGKGRFPAVVLMPDVGSDAENIAVRLADLGYAVVMPDYAGRRRDTFRYTVYPRSLVTSEWAPERLTEYPTDLRFNCWSVWAEIGMRAVTYAASLDFADGERVAVIGAGVASSAALKAAALDRRIKCAVMLYSNGRKDARSDDAACLTYKVALADEAYAPMVRVPLLMMIASNDSDGKADDMSDLFSLIPEETGSRLSVSERTNRTIGGAQQSNIRLWLDKYLRGGDCVVPAVPEVSAAASERKLYYNVKADPACETELFISRGTDAPALRNWSKAVLMLVGDGEYIARADVYDASEKIYAFANARLPGGISVSSPITEKLPSQLGVDATPMTTNRLIYDGDAGADDWTEYTRTDASTPETGSGPFGIGGVMATRGTLGTFKLGDPAYRGKEGYLLQIMLYSETAQFVTITVKAEIKAGKYAEFTHTESVSPEDGWRKITLEATDFKSPAGVCESWEKVFGLTLSADKTIIVASMLWV